MDLDIDLDAYGTAHRYFVLDVFTDTPLAGNQLAVFTDGEQFDGATMQRIARELALSETAFVLPPQNGGDARIRIFTPSAELPFAGHPALGTAFVVASALSLDHVRLETAGGTIPVTLERTDGRVSFGRMEQPIPTWAPYRHTDELHAALRISRSRLPVEVYTNGPMHVFVVLDSERQVAALAPEMTRLRPLGTASFSCLARRADGGWKTRMFAPALGVPEDPATGSGAGPLAVQLARHGLIEFGEEIEIYQGAEISRPSLLHARVEGSRREIERVEVGGSAVIVARGEFRLPAPPDRG
jgi:trans-2,3-dihydro-3-hydroxyanthranilate isomerase